MPTAIIALAQLRGGKRHGMDTIKLTSSEETVGFKANGHTHVFSAGGRNTWILREVLNQSNIIRFFREDIDLSQWAAIDKFKELCVRACLSPHRWAQSVI